MKIKRLTINEIDNFKNLIEIFKEVFENDQPFPSEDYLARLLSNPDYIVVVAEIDGAIIGGLTVFILHTSTSEKPVAYIYDVGVKPNFQRKGTGKLLIEFLTDYCKENGFLEAYVEAETDDTMSVNFYRKTKFSSEMQATHFTYTFDAK